MNEITSSTLYCVTRADSIKYALMILMLLCVAGSVAATCIAGYYANDELGDYSINKENSKVPRAIKWVRNSVCAFLSAMILYSLTPTTREMTIIFVLPQLVQSKVIQQDMPKLYSLAVDELKSVLNDTKGKVEQNEKNIPVRPDDGL